MAGLQEEFQYFPRCTGLKINHLCFADDAILMCHGDKRSVSIIMEFFDRFTAASGLKISQQKSEIICMGMSDSAKQDLIHMTRFKHGDLPIKYLGVPLTPIQLTKSDAHILIDKIINRIQSWAGKRLSYARRVQLANSVLMTMHIYGASIFLLAKYVIHQVEQAC